MPITELFRCRPVSNSCRLPVRSGYRGARLRNSLCPVRSPTSCSPCRQALSARDKDRSSHRASIGWASSDVWAAHVWQTRKLYRSSREQDGYLSVLQNVSCCPAKDHLSQSALRVGALNQKVAARRLGCR